MTEAPEPPTPTVSVGVLERVCDVLAKVALVAMMAIIGGEVVLRSTLHYSWEGTDEVASYLVVAITFLSLATCQAYRGYHELSIVKGRLSPRGRALLDAALHLICLLAALVLLWQFSRLVLNSWKSGDVSSTGLAIPYWIPQLTMPLGVAAFSLALVKEIVLNIKMVRTPVPGAAPTRTGQENG